MRSDSPSSPKAADLAHRILEAARHRLFTLGIRALTMDDLARDLGVSKKTLYVHFPGKEAIANKIVDFFGRNMRARFDAILDDNSLSFADKMCAISDTIGSAVSKINPAMLRELQTQAPGIYDRIDELRKKNIPYVFGRILREGQQAGHVRADLDVEFATQFWLQAMRGMMHPDILDQTGLQPRQVLEKAIPLFFNGVLTPEGRREFGRHASYCFDKQHPTMG